MEGDFKPNTINLLKSNFMNPCINELQIRNTFQEQTGISKDEIKEITSAMPISDIAHLYTNDKSFYFKITPTGKARKKSFVEEE